MADAEQIVALMRQTADNRGCLNLYVTAEAKTGDSDTFTLHWTGKRHRRITFSGCRMPGEPTPSQVIEATLKAITSMDEELVKPKVKTTTPIHDAIFGMRG